MHVSSVNTVHPSTLDLTRHKRNVTEVYRSEQQPTRLIFRFSPNKPIKISLSNIEEADRLKDATGIYLNIASRVFDDYKLKFQTYDEKDIQSFIETRKTRISVLDCGAGDGTALDSLLTQYSEKIEKCTGISMHYFKKVKEYIRKHNGRFEWYAAKAQNVLPELREGFDLITDLFGAYFYSIERSFLLNNYYRTLKDGGRAYIWVGSYIKSTIKLSEQVSENLEESLVRRFPGNFSWGMDKSVLIMYKRATPRPFSLSLRIIEVKESCWELDDSENIGEEQKRAGQLYFPEKVVFASD